jgi:hypothetical protein
MDNADAQIEELKQEVALLREQLARAEVKISKCQTDVAALEEVSKSEIVKMWQRFQDLADAQLNDYTHAANNIDYIYKRLREIDGCIWPVVHKIFPKYSDDMKRIEALIGEPVPPPGDIRPTRDR